MYSVVLDLVPQYLSERNKFPLRIDLLRAQAEEARGGEGGGGSAGIFSSQAAPHHVVALSAAR